VKWYLDAVDPDGRAAIVYAGSLSLAGVRFGYASFFLREPGLPARERATAFGVTLPGELAGVISFAHSGLAVETRHVPIDPPLERTLFESLLGNLRWSCAAPRAEATIRIGDATVTGLGYAESLRLTIAPWDLPIETLHWGRALSRERSAVWIRWEGPEPLSLLAIDGIERPALRIEPRRVAWEGGAIDLVAEETLRDAPIGGRILSTLPGIGSFAPTAILAAHETKWLSRASFDPAGSRDASAFAIHEVVRFRPPRAPGARR
jgi:hypothetical protein